MPSSLKKNISCVRHCDSDMWFISFCLFWKMVTYGDLVLSLYSFLWLTRLLAEAQIVSRISFWGTLGVYVWPQGSWQLLFSLGHHGFRVLACIETWWRLLRFCDMMVPFFSHQDNVLVSFKNLQAIVGYVEHFVLLLHSVILSGWGASGG